MLSKSEIRRKYFFIRKKNYFEVNKNFFRPLINILNKKFKNKKIKLSFYYPANYEVNVLFLFNLINMKKNIISLLPSISGKNNMNFNKWNILDPLKVNKYGMLEPFTSYENVVPSVILVPLLAFDKKNYRLGYGKGYYDKYLNKFLKINHNILTVGVAFSFQKYNKLPTSNYDVKLDYILTEKSMCKL